MFGEYLLIDTHAFQLTGNSRFPEHNTSGRGFPYKKSRDFVAIFPGKKVNKVDIVQEFILFTTVILFNYHKIPKFKPDYLS